MFSHIKFAGLPVDDQDRAVAFYTEKVGLEVATDGPYQEGWRWIELEIPGAPTRLLLEKREGEGQVDTPQLVLTAADVEEVHRRLLDNGVEFTQSPIQAPWNPGETFAQFRDSEGNGIVVTSGD